MKEPKKTKIIKLKDFKITELNYNYNINSKLKELTIGLKYKVEFNESSNKRYSVIFHLLIENIEQEFVLECKAVALFETSKPIDKDFKISNFVQTNSPAIAFPFLRSFINTFTTNAGIKPIILPAFNFAAAKEVTKEEKE
ncbi:hypothetical protein FHQ18_00435 [Deferribacter autotrophicus]|uniref:Preprotein translocase subunit SecB n=1 Tax=Deferribacter autotrophicus TaxID=500465 RepID=A0A5A8F834_9BACT|nr:protein-export chaperone SecB [Deferribacter autotrophicus]KAA0259378.1 hypothetical protein FHQ18_00435 [Deferribacter autotrophicus]